MADGKLLVYGANGFTGKLICERAVQRSMSVIAAGRSADAVRSVADPLGLAQRVFSLDDPAAVREGLSGVAAVLHCAGPYSHTSRPMVDGCLAAGVHYLDITGELGVIDAVLSRDVEAKARGIVLMPAVGFDVVPTDCMAAKVAQALPGAENLELAFGGGAFVASPGTAKTTVEGLALGSKARRGGELVTLSAPLVRDVPFARGARTKTCMSIPWGDLASAYRTTGIGNITVYSAAPAALRRGARILPLIAPLLTLPSVQTFLKKQAGKASGPSAEQRRTIRMWIWGRASGADGRAVEGHLGVPEGYELTVLASLEIASRVLSGKVAPGARTPAGTFGADFVTELPGVGKFDLVAPA